MAGDTFDGFDGFDRDEHAEFIDDDIEFIDAEDLDDDEYDDELEPLTFEDVAEAIGLPDELPAVRLLPVAELAAQARAAATPSKLGQLVEWVGPDGRTTDEAGDLPPSDVEDAARALGVDEGELLFLWEYALTGDWLEFDDEDDEDEDEDEDLDEDDEDEDLDEDLDEDAGGEPDGAGPAALDLDGGEDISSFDLARALAGEANVRPAETAELWASGQDEGVLSAWRKTLLSVLTSTFDVVLDAAPDPAAALDFDGQGIATALMLFLARGEGLALSDISEVISETAGAELEPDEASEAREAWVNAYGDPGRLLIAMLAQLGAVTLPDADDGTVRLTPLALWALREELLDIGVTVPVLPATVEDMTATQLLQVAGDANQSEFESESDAWVATRDPEQAARELLQVAADDGPDSRVLAVSVVTRIGGAAEPAWRDSLTTPELRPYAKIALAGLAVTPAEDVPADLEPLPEDFAWVATDMLVLACDDDDPDPDAINECLGGSVPEGGEAQLFDMMSRAAHPDAVEVLKHIGRHHPDKSVAKEARTAAHKAESRRNGTLS